MRPWIGVGLLAFLIVASPSGVLAQASAPAPEVRITGFIDTITSWSKNLQDSLVYRDGDREWYARNRGRFDIVGQLGAAKAVLGIEIDSTWGQASGGDNNLASGGIFPQRFGASSAFDINTDTQGSMEVKWLYTEFPLSFVPIPMVVRLGAQPFATPYKAGVYSTGDFPGVNVDMTFSRHLIGHLTYVAIEENLTGGRRNLGFGRGDDWAMIATVEVLPLRGLELQPLYSFVQLYGSTSTAVRPPGIGSITGPLTFNRASPGGALGVGQIENRHTIGIDARWRSGPFSLEPTVLYQFGDRDTDNPFVAGNSSAKDRVTEARISAWFIDVIGSWRVGPVLLEGRYMYTTGNRPKDQLNRDVNYYQPLDTDTGYWAGWGEIYGLGLDYFNGAFKGMGAQITFDRYGRQQFALRATYNITPDLDLRGLVSPGWTARSVDTDGQTTFQSFGGAVGPIQCAANSSGKGAGCNGDASYIGTEASLGLTWRFAPGLTLDLAGSVLFAGHALDSSEIHNGVLTHMDAKNIYTVVSRVRYSF